MLNHEKGAPPLYSQLESIIKMQIERGEYNRGDFLPTEKMLMDQYEVSRVTVRQAMAALSQAGYIKCSRGIGTEVIYEKIDEHMKSVISFTDEENGKNGSRYYTSKLSEAERSRMIGDIQLDMLGGLG